MVSLKVINREKNRWLIPLRKIETVYYKDILKMLSHYANVYSQKYDSVQEHDNIQDKNAFKNDLIKISYQNIKKAIAKAVSITDNQISLELKSDFFDIETYLSEYILTNAFEEAMVGITNNYYLILSKIVSDGIKNELTRAEIAKQLTQTSKVNKIRAKVIARTETHNASMYASERRAKDISNELDIEMYKQWIPVEDSRVRPEHSAMRRHKAIPINQMFTVGGLKMSRPSDPRGGASNVVNCRCVMRYIVKD